VVSVHSVDLVSDRQISSFVFLGFVYKVCVGRSERQISSFVFLGFVYCIKFVLDEVKGSERHGCCFYILREREYKYKVDG
jgi:hypothetical protein